MASPVLERADKRCHAKRMPKRTQTKKSSSRRPLPDDSQNALSVVEKAIGGKLVDQPAKERRPAQKRRRTAAKA
jgi:hypothetical protein